MSTANSAQTQAATLRRMTIKVIAFRTFTISSLPVVLSTLTPALVPIEYPAMSTGGTNLSKEFFELLKAIGESKSKQEEDRIGTPRDPPRLKKKLEAYPTVPGQLNRPQHAPQQQEACEGNSQHASYMSKCWVMTLVSDTSRPRVDRVSSPCITSEQDTLFAAPALLRLTNFRFKRCQSNAGAIYSPVMSWRFAGPFGLYQHHHCGHGPSRFNWRSRKALGSHKRELYAKRLLYACTAAIKLLRRLLHSLISWKNCAKSCATGTLR
jgi:hypothetical protein